jgi:hypothetical protein
VNQVSVCTNKLKIDLFEVENICEHTDIKKNSAIKSLVDDVVLKDLIVQGTRGTLSSRHVC